MRYSCDLLHFAIILCFKYVEAKCHREESYIVRNVIKSEIHPLIENYHVVLPKSCPLNLQRDVFKPEEDQKLQESAQQWRCNVCGKTFYEQRFLSLHFDNRHPELYKETDTTVCLAEMCDIFRCDVLTGYRKPSFWDKALCRDNDLLEKYSKCKSIISQCIPTFLIGDEKKAFQDELLELVCGKLNCNDFWHVPESKDNPTKTALYVCVTLMIAIFLAMYYYIAYSHFYTDDSMLDPLESEGRRRQKRHHRVIDGNQEIRQRSGIS